MISSFLTLSRRLIPSKLFNIKMCVTVRRPDKQPAILCTEEEIDAGGKFIKEKDDLNGQISELIGRTIQHIKKGKYSKR